MNSASSHSGLGGRPRIGFTFFTRKGQAQKHSPRHPDIAIDLCTQELLVYDGCSCGPCFSLTLNVLNCASLCEVMNGCPELGTIEGINLPETICEALSSAPSLGTIQA